MSFQVLVVPEDPRYNGAILKPLFEKLLAEAGRPFARVVVSHGWKQRGYEAVMASLSDLIGQYRYFDLIVLVVDSDGRLPGRLQRMAIEETKARDAGARLVGVVAVEEVETWLLMGHLPRLRASWREVRSDASVKENHFQPFLKEFGDPTSPDGGRGRLMLEALQDFNGILQRCDELRHLLGRIRELP
ncbi:MAG: hypothetical protein IT581_02885 [Verrucomicrobiales bacterium]|nr:hypothetical protein [Verrucomicrobiales bacterium]